MNDMKKLILMLVCLVALGLHTLHAQKVKIKGGGDKNKVNIKVKDDQFKVKIKTGGKNDKVKVDIKSNNHGGNGDQGKHGWYGPGNSDFGHSRGNIWWFYGPGDIYLVQGKKKKQKIIVFNQVCVRLSTNITFMFGLLGDIRIKLDGKKAKMKPGRYKKLKIEIDLLDDELRLIEIKKKKIKLRLGILNEDNEDNDGNED